MVCVLPPVFLAAPLTGHSSWTHSWTLVSLISHCGIEFNETIEQSRDKKEQKCFVYRVVLATLVPHLI